MTSKQLEKLLIAEFGPFGKGLQAYEDFLHISHGALPKTLEHYQWGQRKRYCPKAIAEYLASHRVIGYVE